MPASFRFRPAEDSEDYFVIEDADGNPIFKVDTVRNRIKYYDTYWDDVRAPATQLKLGATSKPDFDFTNLGLLFPQNDPTEVASIIMQLPHSYSEGTDISPHIHFIQDEVAQPVFKMDYRWYNMGAAVPSFTTGVVFNDFGYTYTSGSLHQRVGTAADLDGTGKDISSIIEVKLYRDDNVVTGDVLVKEFDIHFELDALGSENIGAKS